MSKKSHHTTKYDGLADTRDRRQAENIPYMTDEEIALDNLNRYWNSAQPSDSRLDTPKPHKKRKPILDD